MDLASKFATAELLAIHKSAGLIGEDTELSDYEAVANVIKSVAAESDANPMAMLMNLRFYNEKPHPQLTTCEFDDEREALDYCRRFIVAHGIGCVPVPCGHKRFKIERVNDVD